MRARDVSIDRNSSRSVWPRDLGQGAGEFDAGRSAADEHEREQLALPRRIGLALGFLEGEQKAPANRDGVSSVFKPGRERLPLLVPKYAWREPLATIR
jgi:hypothetical protein